MSLPRGGVVIVGASAAGLSAADGLREGGYFGHITVLDEELEPSYDRPMLSKGLLAQQEERAEPTRLRTTAYLQDNGIEVLAGHGAVGLDLDRQLLVTNYGEALPWNQVVIATGATARPVVTEQGSSLPTLRDRIDYYNARALASRREPVTIIGGGFIGLEVAAALRTRDVPVTILSASPPLQAVVGDAVSAWVSALHRDHGVELDPGARITSVAEAGNGYEIHLADGRVGSAAALLAGIGAEPSTGWLTGSGIDLDDGVLTDAAGLTSAPGVWAAGDVAYSFVPSRGHHRRFGHWTHAIEHGRHIGLNIARGQTAPYEDVSYVWTQQYRRTLHLLGERHNGDLDVVVEGDLGSGEFIVAHGTEDELHAVTICGHVRAIRGYKKLLRASVPLAEAAHAAVLA